MSSQIHSEIDKRFTALELGQDRLLREVSANTKQLERINGSVAENTRFKDQHLHDHEKAIEVKEALAAQALTLAKKAEKRSQWWQWGIGLVVVLALGGDDLAALVERIAN